MENLRTLIEDYLREKIEPNEQVALLYSGGFESFSLLCSLIHIGAKPHLYTFALDGVKSRDMEKARNDAKVFALELTEIIIPRTIEELVRVTKDIIKTFGTSRKTVVQCLFPMWYTIPKITEKKVVSGLEKGNLWGDTKNGAIAACKGFDAFNEYRKKEVLKDEKGSVAFYEKYLEMCGKTSIRPYGDDDIWLWFMGHTYDSLNKPKTKQPIRDAYSLEINATKMALHTANYQIESGIKQYHDEFLTMPNYNPNGKYKSVVGVYNNILKEIQNGGIQLQLEF